MHTSPRMRAAQAKHIPPISPLLNDDAPLPPGRRIGEGNLSSLARPICSREEGLDSG